jgi:hypothetical protein
MTVIDKIQIGEVLDQAKGAISCRDLDLAPSVDDYVDVHWRVSIGAQ